MRLLLWQLAFFRGREKGEAVEGVGVRGGGGGRRWRHCLECLCGVITFLRLGCVRVHIVDNGECVHEWFEHTS